MTTTPTDAARASGTIKAEIEVLRLAHARLSYAADTFHDQGAHGQSDACRSVADSILEALRLAAIQPDPEPKHPDEEAVDRFAAAMKTKLRKKRAEGRSGWDGPECDANVLTRLLREHVEKGDPLDVGNLSMMLHQRGERIQTDPEPQSVAGAGPGEKPHAYSPDLIAGGDDCRHCGHGWDLHQPATPSSAGTVSVEAAEQLARDCARRYEQAANYAKAEACRFVASQISALRALAGEGER